LASLMLAAAAGSTAPPDDKLPDHPARITAPRPRRRSRRAAPEAIVSAVAHGSGRPNTGHQAVTIAAIRPRSISI